MNHRQAINELDKRVGEQYQEVYIEVPYYEGKRMKGEIDYIGINGEVDLYEVKSSKNRRAKSKGKEQLKRAYRTFDRIDLNLFLGMGNEDGEKRIDIKEINP